IALTRPDGKRIRALFVAERRAKVLPLNAPTHESARLRSHGVGHREIARRENSRNLADLRPRRLSLGSHAKANRAHARAFRAILQDVRKVKDCVVEQKGFEPSTPTFHADAQFHLQTATRLNRGKVLGTGSTGSSG